MSNITELKSVAVRDIETAETLEELDTVRVKVTGKNGLLTAEMKKLGGLSPEDRKLVGQGLNAFRDEFNALLQVKKSFLEDEALAVQLKTERVDMTLPVSPNKPGRLHPITQVMEDITNIFAQMGFSVEEGPDLETDHYNFSALNIPETHPARQMHDTFYVKPIDESSEPLLLRTHTSPVQIRTMESQKPPIRIIAPGKTYRCDSDQTHTPMFHQIEGLYIDKIENVHMGHLKSCIQTFCRAFFNSSDLPIRFRPSFFPFTEPSAEVDIGCQHTKDGIAIGAGSDWLEVMGCGMVHPNVLKSCGVDTDKYQGFAFGMGVERLAMLKYNIPDLRTFFEGSRPWIQHYGFAPYAASYNSQKDAS